MTLTFTYTGTTATGGGGASATLTLFDLTYRIARELGAVYEGTATGGTVGTLIDTVDRTEADDFWNGGTLWLLNDASGPGGAPQGEYAYVSDFTATSDTVAFRANMTAAPASGDTYAIADKRWPLHVLIQVVNMALQDMGRIPVYDSTSLTTADNQTEYNLPAAVHPQNLKQVFIQNENNDSDDNRWQEIFNWDVIVTATGTVDKLVLPYQYASGYDLLLVYTGLHPEMRTATAQLSESVPMERVVYPGAYLAYKWWKDKYGKQDKDEQLNIMAQRAERAKQEHPIWTPRKPSKIVEVANTEWRPKTIPNKVYLTGR